MLKKEGLFDIFNPETKLEVDIMNKNTIIGLSMMYALWDSKRTDLLSVITPFVLYCVGTTTSVGQQIDVERVCKKMEEEFGYKHFLPGVVNRILTRLTKKKDASPVISKQNMHYFLSNNIDDTISAFREKRTICKERTEKLTDALVEFLNEKGAYGRRNYSDSEAERYLLAFFEKRGESILLSIEDLRQLLKSDNEIDYYIGRFILDIFDKKSSLQDHIIELIVGYYITTAIYLQADNAEINSAAFKDVTFYLDTPILLSILGYKSNAENSSAQATINSLQKSGAKLACFDYNLEEVASILTAYYNSIISRYRKPSTTTLESFDERHFSASQVQTEKDIYVHRLESLGITSFSFSDAPISADFKGLLNDERIKEILLGMYPRYNLSALSDDIQAVNTVSRIRGKTINPIEKCKAVFATTNTPLVIATKKYFSETSYSPGFPIAITVDELCVMAWLKDFEKDSQLPKMRLMENVLAATSPSEELLESYFGYIEQLEQAGELSDEDAVFLRMNQYARNDLMELTGGKNNEVTVNTVRSIKAKTIDQYKETGYKEGKDEGYQNAHNEWKKDLNDRKNTMCRKIEQSVSEEYIGKTNRFLFICKLVSWILALFLVAGTVLSIVFLFSNSSGLYVIIPLAIATIVQAWQACLPILRKDNWLTKYVRKRLEKEKENSIDKQKKQYLSAFDDAESEK